MRRLCSMAAPICIAIECTVVIVFFLLLTVYFWWKIIHLSHSIVDCGKWGSSLCLQFQWKKRSERRKHCALAVVRQSQKFSPGRRPLPRGAGRPKFNQLEMVTTFTYKPRFVRIDACNFELSWYYTHKHIHKHTNTHTQNHRRDRLQYTAPQLSAQCNYATTTKEWPDGPLCRTTT